MTGPSTSPDDVQAEALDRRRTLLALLGSGPERHATCCGFSCEFCAGYGTTCERCEDVLLTMADDAVMT